MRTNREAVGFVTQALANTEGPGSLRFSAITGWPGRWKSSFALVAVDILGDPMKGTSSRPRSSMISCTALTCPAPPSISQKIRPGLGLA